MPPNCWEFQPDQVCEARRLRLKTISQVMKPSQPSPLTDIYQSLRASFPPFQHRARLVTVTERVFCSISALDSLELPRSQHCQEFQSLWDRIWAWINMSVRNFVLAKQSRRLDDEAELRERIIWTTAAILSIPRYFSDSRSEGESTSSQWPIGNHAIETLLKLIIHLAGTKHQAFALIWLRMFTHYEDQLYTIPNLKDMFLRNKIDRVYLRRTEEECNNPEFDPEVLNALATFGLFLCSSESRPDGSLKNSDIWHAMLSKGLIKRIVLVFHHIYSSANTTRVGDLVAVRDCMVHYCTLVMGPLQLAFTWVIEFLDREFVFALTRALSVLGFDGLVGDSATFILVNVLQPYLIYRSTLNRLIRELKAIRESFSIPPASSYGRALKLLEQESSRMKDIMHDFDAKDPGRCSNPQRRNLNRTVEGVNTSGARVVELRYIALTTVKKSIGYLDTAKHARNPDKVGKTYALSTLDQAFVIGLVEAELNQNWTRIEQVMNNCLPSQGLVVVIDFCKCPVEVSTSYNRLNRSVVVSNEAPWQIGVRLPGIDDSIAPGMEQGLHEVFNTLLSRNASTRSRITMS
ncbi:hypothetical protein VNI00_008732 [Paramarasmius palmivorus]|uniref:Uncharacterized protein n=1 Tax=Paramarasmius palmivorus TaxID=297713 RepID=A0AAW0CWQ2_9AGAR